jgi:hypothetical protein
MAASTFVRALSSASFLALGTLLAWTPQSARAQGFAGTGTVDFGTATIDVATPGTTNVNLPNTSERATITWTPTDTGVGGGPIDFLPSGNIVNYTGDAGASGPYTVLNRIIPADLSRSVAFNGTVNSASNVRVFFYSPGGLLIGSTARFNVGGLLLSTSDLVLNGANDFMPVQDQFSVAGAVGSTAAIEIQAGAEIRAESVGQSNYVVAIAPRVQQDGLISARGSVALVAAESADFAIDSQGLFNITVSQGSEVSSNTFSHTGSTGGPDAAGAGEFRRVYMVAVPKNNAISMAIQSGGSIGFDIAGAASLVGNTIVLSAGHNIADTGTGDPIVATQAGVGTADITVSRGSYTSNTIVRSMTNATVADNIIGGTPDINFASDLSVRAASSAAVRADQGTVAIAGVVNVNASAPTNGIAGQATLAVGGLGTSLTAGFANVSANNTDTNSPFAIGGIAQVISTGGSMTIANGIDVSARAQGFDASSGGNGGGAFGGTVLISATNGGTITATSGDIAAAAWAVGGNGGDNIGDLGGNAQGGGVRIETFGAGSAVAAGLTIAADAGASGGSAGVNNGKGGDATGGTAELLATNGNISVTSATGFGLDLVADAIGGDGGRSGNAIGGSSNVFAENATISTFGDYGLSINTSAIGGTGFSIVGDGGNATGGFIDIKTIGSTGRIETNIGGGGAGMGLFGMELVAQAEGGNAILSGTNGGSATGGNITLSVTAAGQDIVNNSAMGTNLNVNATGGNAGIGGQGGNADGGSAKIGIDGGLFSVTAGSIGLSSSAQGGITFVENTGNATGGLVELRVAGDTTIAGGITASAAAVGVSGTAGGNAEAGRVSVLVEGATLTAIGPVSLDVLAAGGDATSAAGGNATGGIIDLSATNANIIINGDFNLTTRTIGGNGIGTFGGFAYGGAARVYADNSDISLAAVSGNVILQNGAAPGMGDFLGEARVRNAVFETTTTGRIELGGTSTGSIGDVTASGTISALANSLYLTLSAARNVRVESTIVNAQAGSSIVLRAGNSGSTTAQVTFGAGDTLDLSGAGSTIDIYSNPALIGSPTDYSSSIVSGILTNYQLVHTATQLQSINSYLSQNFALARDVDVGSLASANGGTGFLPIGTDALGNVTNGTGFTGNFDGQGYSVRNLFINRLGQQHQGLFGYATSATIKNLNVVDAAIVGGGNTGSLIGWANGGTYRNIHGSGTITGDGSGFGGLIGQLTDNAGPALLTDSSASVNVTINSGVVGVGGLVGYVGNGSATVTRSWATGNVTFTNASNGAVGGLVGYNDGNISETYATGSVTGTNTNSVGGLVGHHGFGNIERSYAIGDILGNDSVGGLVGHQLGGTISQTYASGAIVGNTNVGGLVGNQSGGSATIENSYWDSYSTGQSVGFGNQAGTITNLGAVTSDPGQSNAPNYAFDPQAYQNFTNADWTDFGSESRPIGAWEIPTIENGVYSIRSAHQLQFIENDLAGKYRLAFDINAFEFLTGRSVLGGGGFMPLGSGVAPFTGQFDGAGHVVSNLYINRPTGNIGLFDTNSGTIRNVGLVNVTLSGGNNRTGALVGTNNGMIFGSFATGTINTTGNVAGGLVGENNNVGTITQSYASVDVTGVNTAGGLAGINAGTISFSFANGPVFAPNAGGLVGTNAVLATIANSYWDTQASGRANACGVDNGTNCGAATGLTTAQTRQSSSFGGWSIDTVGGQNNIWRIYEGASGPLLKAFLKPLFLSPADVTQVYDTTIANMPVVPIFANQSRIFGTAVVTGANANVGVYAVSYGGGLSSVQTGYDLISGPAGTLTVTPAPLTVTATAASRLYGDVNPALTYNAVGLLGADTLVGSLDTAANALSGIGGYAITQGTLSNANYSINYNGDTLTVNPRPLTVTADASNRIYGDANPAFTYLVGGSGLVNGDMLTGALDSLANTTSGIGTYAIDQGTLAASANYTLNYIGANLTVAARAITVTGDTIARLYGDANPALTYTVGGLGLVNGDALAGSLNTLANGTSNIGSYAVTQGTLAASPNYALTYVDGAVNVTPRGITIVADAISRLYGDANPAFTYAVSGAGLVNGDTLTGALDSAATVVSNVGTYAINQGTVAASSNYIVNYTGADLSVTARPLSVTADAASRLYGDANQAFTYTATGLVNGDTLAGALDTTATIASNVGAFAISQGTLDNSNYAISYTGANLDILVRPITVTGDTLVRLYGDANPALTYAVSGAGLVNGDTLSGALDTLANGTSNVGAYGVTQGTLSASSNYALTFVDGLINVNARPLSVVADALSRIYGDANPGLTFTATGLVNGDTLTGALDSLATVTSNVGTYTIDQATLSASANYVLNYTGANLTVIARPLSVIANTMSRIYGDVNPTLTFTSAGLANGDTLTGALDVAAGITANVGTYAISQGTITASPNYAINYTGANLNVTARPLSVIADAASRTYGDANPAFTYTAFGLVNGDTLTGTLGSMASVASNVGTYTVDQSTLAASANYVLNYTGANLLVSARALSVTGDALSRIYGDANPGLTFTATGLVNGDTLTGSLGTSATVASNIGNYAVTQGTLAASANYTLSYSDGSLTITPRALSVVADTFTRVYGDANPTLTYTASGLANGDTLTGVLDTPASVTSGVGTYSINQGTVAASPNYAVSFTNGLLSVTPRPITITADAKARQQGDANPVLTFSVSGRGLVNGDQIIGTLSTNASNNSPSGTYAIGQGTLAPSVNYSVTYVGAALVITPCTAGPNCGPPAAVMEAVSQIGTDVQQQDEEAEATEEAKREAAEASSADPKVMIQSVIDTSTFNQPLPVRDPVAGVGNSTIWIPGDSE